MEARSPLKVIDAFRIMKYTKEGSRKTNWVKITFLGDKLPKEIQLNYVLLPVNEYIPPVQQCYKCYKFGHSSKKCLNKKLCRTCLKEYHGDICNDEPTCLHCKGDHTSIDRTCPEYTRQTKIKERMHSMKENFITASNLFPKNYLNSRESRNKTSSYATITQNSTFSNYITTKNSYQGLDNLTVVDHEETIPYNNSFFHRPQYQKPRERPTTRQPKTYVAANNRSDRANTNELKQQDNPNEQSSNRKPSDDSVRNLNMQANKQKLNDAIFKLKCKEWTQKFIQMSDNEKNDNNFDEGYLTPLLKQFITHIINDLATLNKPTKTNE